MQALVLVEIKSKKIDKTFTYNVLKEQKENIKVGIRVLVPFGKQTLEGFVLELNEDKEYDYPLKNIISLVDTKPVINEEMLELGLHISKNTFSTLISAYQTMLPSALKAKNGFLVNKKYDIYLELVDNSFVPKTCVSRRILE